MSIGKNEVLKDQSYIKRVFFYFCFGFLYGKSWDVIAIPFNVRCLEFVERMANQKCV